MLLIFPAMTMLARREWRKPARLAMWYSVPAAYLVISYLRYAHSEGRSYQESVLRKSRSLAGIASDWAFNISASLKFWDWESLDRRTPPSEAHWLATMAAVVFATGREAVIRLGSPPSPARLKKSPAA